MSGPSQTTSTASSESFSGRKKELRFISDGLLNVGRSETALMVVKGPAGIGKTSLISRVLECHPDEKSFKIYGKFENRENPPYAAFRQAFSAWAQQILLLPDNEFDSLKESTTSALQTNIPAITAVFPELEVFFSRKKVMGNHLVDVYQVKAQFYYFLKKFFKSITGLGYHLFFFLDDLQWSDKASFALLKELVRAKDIPGLIFIAASRTAEENYTAEFNRLDQLQVLENVRSIQLKPLSRAAVAAMIPRNLNFSKKNLEIFRNYLWLESSGNPFRITEILRIIRRENPEGLTAEDPQFWASLPKLNSGEDTVTFMQEQLRNLPFDQLKVLGAASCLGYSFGPELLNKILSFPQGVILKQLNALIKMDLLIRKKKIYVFTHDTIFSAANSLLSNSEKCALHQRIGISILEELTNYKKQDFFLAVNHLNRAHDLAGSGKIYSNEQILLNIQAGKLATKKAAFEIAFQYFAFADKLCNEEVSSVRLKDEILKEIFGKDEIGVGTLRFHILYGHAETSFLLQKFETALDFIRQVLETDCNRHQRMQATLVKMMVCSALIHQKNLPDLLWDAVVSLEQVLGQYEIVIPADKEKIKKECAEDKNILMVKAAGLDLNTNFSKLINPDEEYQDLMNLVTTSMTLLYYADPHKSLYMVSKALLQTLEKGFAPVSPVLFAASFFSGFLNEQNQNLAHFLGKVSLKMIEKEPFKRYAYRVHYIAALNFFPWENHYSICIEKLEEGAQQAMEAGDPHYASFCQTVGRMLNTYRGKNLIRHMEDCEKMEKDHHVFFISGTDNTLSGYLTGKESGFEIGDFRFPQEIVQESQHNPTVRYSLLLAQEKINYHAGFFEAAVSAAEECDSLDYIGKGFELEHFFFYSLSLLQLAFLKPEASQAVLKKIEPKLKEFRRLTLFKSGNFLHKVYLLEAEIAKCTGDFEQATLLYDNAIKEAREQGFVHHAAIAAERAAEYYRYKGRIKPSRYYLKKSIKYYDQWGARAKVEQLKKQNPSLKKEINSKEKASMPVANFSAIREILEKTVPGNQVPLQEVAQYLVSVLQKEGRAKKAIILLFQQNEWKVLAVEPNVAELVGKPLHQLRENLPVSILNYSIKQGEKQVLQDVVINSLFAEDRYLKRERPENVSIFPIKQSGETIGLLYLENCKINSGTGRNFFLMLLELASTTFANAVYYENNDILNKELKLQERNRIEAVIESQEKERLRIARELHDSLGQILSLSKINLSRLDTHEMAPENKILLDQVSDLIDDSCREVRTISHNLMPPDLDNRTLPEILENLINKNRQAKGTVYEFHSHDLSRDPSVACKFTIYRVLQEILQNIIKHASASKVCISLAQSGDFVNLLVEDNGKGFNTNLTSFGIGLKNIHSRIKLLDGYLDIDSSINNGTVFNVSIPLKP